MYIRLFFLFHPFFSFTACLGRCIMMLMGSFTVGLYTTFFKVFFRGGVEKDIDRV